jgi:deazaflavin-dependent oxidoreductase (nitroreductase family)
MARTYRLSPARRALNALVRTGLRVGVGPPRTWLLTVVGRRTGKRYTTPVTLVERDGQRYLVAPYGEVAWVRNARAAGEVELARGRRRETLGLEPLPAGESGAILRAYAQEVAVTRPFFDARPTDPPEAFAAEADRHPAFRLRSLAM